MHKQFCLFVLWALYLLSKIDHSWSFSLCTKGLKIWFYIDKFRWLWTRSASNSTNLLLIWYWFHRRDLSLYWHDGNVEQILHYLYKRKIKRNMLYISMIGLLCILFIHFTTYDKHNFWSIWRTILSEIFIRPFIAVVSYLSHIL